MSTIKINNMEYTIHEKDDGNILLKPIKKIIINDLDSLTKYNFTKSEIISCKINNELYNKNKYKSILNNIYNIIDDGVQIIKNTLLHIKTIKKEDEGFYYLKNLGISVQGVDSNKCIYEIVNQCLTNKIKIEINITLYNKDVIEIII